MKNILLTGQLIWEALQAESGDFDVLWEVLQSQKIQGYITQNDLDSLYRQIAQEQDVSIAFNLVNQLQRVLLIYSPNRSQIIDIEVNNNIYSHSVAVEVNDASVLSLHGFLERYALNMLYANDSLTDGSDAEISLGMQKWYRKWRQSGFDMLWLIPVVLTLTLQSMPFFQKFVADLFEQLEGGQAPQPPDVAQKIRRTSPALPEGKRSPDLSRPQLPDRNSSQSEFSSPRSTEELNLPNLRGHSLRYPSSAPASLRGEQTAIPTKPKPQPLTAPRSPQMPTEPYPIHRAIETPAPSTTPDTPSIAPLPITAPGEIEEPNVEPIDDQIFVPTPVFMPPPSEGSPGTPISPPANPANDPLPAIDPPPTTPPTNDLQLDIAGDGVTNIPDPLTDPFSIADPYFPNQPQSQPPNQPDLGLPPDAQSSFPKDWSNGSETGGLNYGQSYQLTIAPEVQIQAIGGMGVISVNPYGIELNFDDIGINSEGVLSQFLPSRY
jgi:hypothetical protein